MAGLSSVYGQRNNPHERRARVAGEVMGNSGFAKPALAYVMGQEMNQAGAWDEKQAALGQKKERRQQFFKTFDSLVKASKGDAVVFWNEMAAEALGASFKIEGVIDTPEMIGVKEMGESGKIWGFDKRTQQPMTFTPGGKKWEPMTPADEKHFKEGKEGEVPGTTKEARQWHSNALSALKPFYGKITDYGFVLNPDASEEFEYAMTFLEKYRAQGMDANQAAIKAKEEAEQTLLKKRLPGTLADMPRPTPDQLDMLKTPRDVAPGAPVAGQPLDEATAAQILQEAGGDVNRAREIAKQRGFTF